MELHNACPAHTDLSSRLLIRYPPSLTRVQSSDDDCRHQPAERKRRFRHRSLGWVAQGSDPKSESASSQGVCRIFKDSALTMSVGSRRGPGLNTGLTTEPSAAAASAASMSPSLNVVLIFSIGSSPFSHIWTSRGMNTLGLAGPMLQPRTVRPESSATESIS